MSRCDLGYSVGAGNFLGPVTVEVVGGAPQYNQKGKVGPTCAAAHLSVYLPALKVVNKLFLFGKCMCL